MAAVGQMEETPLRGTFERGDERDEGERDGLGPGPVPDSPAGTCVSKACEAVWGWCHFQRGWVCVTVRGIKESGGIYLAKMGECRRWGWR